MEPELVRGIDLFNRGAYFAAHEEIEAAWRQERDPLRRRLLQGLVQLAVGFAHLDRRNRHGALTLLAAGRDKLAPFGATAFGVDLAPLRSGVERCLGDIAGCAAEDLAAFDRALIPRIGVVS